MHAIKHILTRYTAVLWAVLKPLGIWGVLAVAAIDGAALGLPVDVAVGGYVAQDHSRWWLYVLMGAAVAEMSISNFLLSIFAGRMVRFLLVALLVLKFGPGAVHRLRIFFSHHFHWILIAAVIAFAAWLVMRWSRKRALKVAGSEQNSAS